MPAERMPNNDLPAAATVAVAHYIAANPVHKAQFEQQKRSMKRRVFYRFLLNTYVRYRTVRTWQPD